MTGSKAASPAAIAAAMQVGNEQRRAAMAQRNAEMVALDKADLSAGEPDPYALTMGVANQPAGMQQFFNVPPIDCPVGNPVAVANAQSGKVPVPQPWKKD
jgi:hypothetical protein